VNSAWPDIILFHKGGRDERRAGIARGETPRDFFYGFLAAEADGHRVHWESVAEPYPGRFGRAVRMWEIAHSMLTGVSWRPHALNRIHYKLERARLLVSFTDQFSLTLGRWALRSGYHQYARRPKFVGLFHGLSDIEARAPRHAKSYLARHIREAGRGLDAMGFLGSADREFCIGKFGLERDKTFVFAFGVDTDFWRPAENGSGNANWVLSVGSDPNRDYRTLLSAKITSPLRIVTRLPIEVGDGRTDVEILKGSYNDAAVTDDVLREFYQKALCVVVPLQDCWQPSGQSVTLQALACGAAVVLTRNRGLWAPDSLVDGENCLLVPPADAGALTVAVDRIKTNPELRMRLSRNARAVAERSGSHRMTEASVRKLVAHLGL
jgi:glycosyltransferase involved in cell wall biosynthesis